MPKETVEVEVKVSGLRRLLLTKLVSRTLWMTGIALLIIFLDAFGLGEWPQEVRIASSTAVVAYILGEKAIGLRQG